MTTSTRVERRRLRVRLLLLSISTILYSGLALPAAAQLAPAPVRHAIDSNGVDLFYGAFTVNGPAISMGQADQGLSYQRLNRGDAWFDYVLPWAYITSSYINVGLGDTVDSFTISGSAYIPQEGDGATLAYDGTSIYTYTRADGTVIHFDHSKVATYPGYSGAGRVTDIRRPSGLTLIFNYDSLPYCSSSKPAHAGSICLTHGNYYRIGSVQNMFGYKLNFGYPAIDPYDPNDPDVPPDVNTWTTLTSASIVNLAAGTGSSSSTETFGYTTTGGVTSFNISDPMGRVSHYRQNSSGLIAGVTKPGSASEDVTIGYAGGRVSSITTAAGTMTYAFADSGSARTVTVTDGLSHVTTYIFDIPSQRMTSKTDALGHTTSWAYDTSGRLTDTTLPEGITTHLTYDARGNVTQTRAVSKTPGTPADIVTSATFDATCANIATCNQPSSTTDANGNVTDYTYDPTHGGTLTVTLPAPTAGAIRPKTTLSYASLQAFYDSGSGIAASGYPTYRMVGISRCQTGATCAGTADEVKTTIDYGPQVAGAGNNLLPVAVTTGAGNGSLAATTAFGYDVIGNTTSIDGPLPGAADTTTYRYDADRELVGVVSPDPDGSGPLTPRAQRITYTPHGIATKKEIGTVNSASEADWAAFSSLQQVTTTLDAADRKMQDVVTAGGTPYQIMQYSYDAASRLDCTALRMNSATWASLPSSACTLATTGSAGPDRITKTLYDNVNRTVQVLSAYGTADVATDATRTYSNNGNVSSLADAQGNLTTYEYDGDDRVVKVRYPNTTTGAGTSSTTDYEQFAYDPNGNVTSRDLRGYASDNTQHIDYTYDALNRVTLKDLPGTEPDVAYSYDSLGRTTSAYTGGNYVSIGYDALGRATSQTTPLGTIAMAYDLAGNRTTTAWPDSFYVNYDHLVTGEVSAIRENGATSGVGVLATYGYDALGRRTSVTRGNGTTTSYSFDAMSRLTSLTQDLAGTANDLSLGLGYNPAGQIASMTRSNDSYAWTSSVDQNLAYTVNGLNQMASVAGGTLSYDARGNLSSTGSNSYSYSSENLLLTGPGTTASYDPLLRLYETTGSATQFYAYDGAQRVAEYSGSGAMLRRYVFGPGDDEPLVWYEGSGTSDRRWLHADERGSMVAVTNSSGASITTNSYDEYGVPGSGNIGAFQYTGQVWLPDLGLYYYKARMYSSRLGRFMQTDPIGYGDGMNWYNYTGGDPVNRSDPSGTDSQWAWSCYGNCGGGYANSVLVDEFGVHSESFITNPDGSLTFTGARDDYYKYYSGGSIASLYMGGSGYSAFSQVGRFAGNGVMGGGSAAALAGTPKNPPTVAAARRQSCLRNIDADTLTGLGLDAVGLAASATGLKAAWTVGSAAVGATTALLSVTFTSFEGENRDQGVAIGGAVAAVGVPFIPEGASAASKAIASSLPGIGVAVSGGILAYDSYNALKKAGCF